MSSIEQIEGQIAQNRNAYVEQSTAIGGDMGLTPAGRSEKLHDLKVATKATHDRLIGERTQAIHAERDRLYQRAFGQGTGSIDTYRSLYAEAVNADAKALGRLRAQALSTGDALLLKATNHAAFDRDLFGQVDNSPEVDALLAFELDHGLRSSPMQRRHQLERRFADSVKLSSPVGRID